jgi:hypothetical protein
LNDQLQMTADDTGLKKTIVVKALEQYFKSAQSQI